MLVTLDSLLYTCGHSRELTHKHTHARTDLNHKLSPFDAETFRNPSERTVHLARSRPRACCSGPSVSVARDCWPCVAS